MSTIRSFQEETALELPDLRKAEDYFTQKQRVAELRSRLAQYQPLQWDSEALSYGKELAANLREEEAWLQELRSRTEMLGEVELIYGPMFSGKTDELILRVRNYRRAGYKVQVFKHSFDTRYGPDKVISHDGLYEDALSITMPTEIPDCVDPDTRVIALDEAQFFSVSDDSPSLVTICERLIELEIRIIVAGLNLDFRGEPFGPMPELMAQADSIIQKTGKCQVCKKRNATRTQRLVNGTPAPYDDRVILIGASETYQPRCRHCHEVPDKPQPRIWR